ncbi:MAG: proline--tRNA ligase [Candidatus Micrarchaeota archaeon]|nr:proline--tRNA ligase [Candidatus Micrarchaeota archaeon]
MQNKKDNFSEWYTEITKEAQLCDLRYNLKGFIVFMPWAVRTMKIMYGAYERELESRGHEPVLFPALIPEGNLSKESAHVEGFVPSVFWVTHAGREKLEERMAMRPTSETAMYPLYSLWIQGLSDLPLKLYQSCQVWRYETKATRPFIRSREFHWIEAHDVFATEAEAMAQVREDIEMTEKVVHSVFGIPVLFFKRPEWDKFPGAVATYAADTLMPDMRVLQLPSTHFLGQNFAKVFDIKYLDSEGKSKFAWQTCYGPAISRIYAALISVHGDDKGLIFPFDLAPVQIAIIPIYAKGNEEKVNKYCSELASRLSSDGFRVKFDSGPQTPGYKFHEWEMKGVPIRIDVGGKELESGELTIARRDTGKKEKIKSNEKSLANHLRSLAPEILSNLKHLAEKSFSSHMHHAKSMQELESSLEKGGFVRVPFCSVSKEGESCAAKIKEKFGGDVRGTIYPEEPVPHGEKCVVCGELASCFVYVARQY